MCGTHKCLHWYFFPFFSGIWFILQQINMSLTFAHSEINDRKQEKALGSCPVSVFQTYRCWLCSAFLRSLGSTVTFPSPSVLNRRRRAPSGIPRQAPHSHRSWWSLTVCGGSLKNRFFIHVTSCGLQKALEGDLQLKHCVTNRCFPQQQSGTPDLAASL